MRKLFCLANAEIMISDADKAYFIHKLGIACENSMSFKITVYEIVKDTWIYSLEKDLDLGWAATNEKTTICRILSLFCRIFWGRQKATARILKSDNLFICRFFCPFLKFLMVFGSKIFSFW